MFQHKFKFSRIYLLALHNVRTSIETTFAMLFSVNYCAHPRCKRQRFWFETVSVEKNAILTCFKVTVESQVKGLVVDVAHEGEE